MTYEKALEMIGKEFKTRYVAPDCQAICVPLTYDGVNGIYIAVWDNEGEAILTDEGITKDIFWKATDETKWRSLCEMNGFSFNCYWHIERKFTAMTDVYDFIDFLMLISNEYNPIDSKV